MPLDKVDLNSIYKIIGKDCKEVMIYGLADCGWQLLIDTFDQLPILTNTYNRFSFEQIDYDDYDNVRRMCKATITSLVLQNYARKLEGKPIIPLIFSIGSEGTTSPVTLSTSKVADSRNEKHYSDSELRRCYKIVSEMPADIRAVAEETFKFVKIVYENFYFDGVMDCYDKFSLKQIAPFWIDQQFTTAWEDRKKQSVNKQPSIFIKQHSWREILTRESQELTAHHQLKHKR